MFDSVAVIYEGLIPSLDLTIGNGLRLAALALTAALCCLLQLASHFGRSSTAPPSDGHASSKEERLLLELPGPRPLPLIGNCIAIGRFATPWEAFLALGKIHGPVFRVTIGTRRCVVVNSFAAMRELLVDRAADFAHRPNFPRFHAIFLDDRDLSLALCDWSEKHRLRRSLIFPHTHPRKGDARSLELAETSRAHINRMIDSILVQQKSASDSVEIAGPVCVAFFRVFLSFLYGLGEVDEATLTSLVSTYTYVVEDLFRGYASDFFAWWERYDRNLGRLRRATQVAVDFTRRVFEQRQKGDERRNDGDDLIDALLRRSSDDKLTEQDCRSALDDLVGGAAAMTPVFVWGLAFAARDARVRDCIRAETRQGGGPGPYTEATVLETLRVVSSPIVPHRTVRETSLQGYRVGSDWVTFLNILSVNTDPALWKDPLTFNPDRFLDADGRSVRKPDYFIPFGIGKRSCLGDGIARPLMATALSLILDRADVSVPDDCPDVANMVGRVIPDKPIRLSFSPAATL